MTFATSVVVRTGLWSKVKEGEESSHGVVEEAGKRKNCWWEDSDCTVSCTALLKPWSNLGGGAKNASYMYIQLDFSCYGQLFFKSVM